MYLSSCVGKPVSHYIGKCVGKMRKPSPALHMVPPNPTSLSTSPVLTSQTEPVCMSAPPYCPLSPVPRLNHELNSSANDYVVVAEDSFLSPLNKMSAANKMVRSLCLNQTGYSRCLTTLSDATPPIGKSFQIQMLRSSPWLCLGQLF